MLQYSDGLNQIEVNEHSKSFERQRVLRTATCTPLDQESTLWEEEKSDEDNEEEDGWTKVQRVTCCGLHDQGTERNG